MYMHHLVYTLLIYNICTTHIAVQLLEQHPEESNDLFLFCFLSPTPLHGLEAAGTVWPDCIVWSVLQAPWDLTHEGPTGVSAAASELKDLGLSPESDGAILEVFCVMFLSTSLHQEEGVARGNTFLSWSVEWALFIHTTTSSKDREHNAHLCGAGSSNAHFRMLIPRREVIKPKLLHNLYYHYKNLWKKKHLYQQLTGPNGRHYIKTYILTYCHYSDRESSSRIVSVLVLS